MSRRFNFAELLRCFRLESSAQQLAGWIDRDHFRGTAIGHGPAQTRTFGTRDGLCATLMTRHLHGFAGSAAEAAIIANRAAGEIMRSPAFDILEDPAHAPDGEFLLQIARADIWVVRMVRREELDFTLAETSLIIDVGRLLRELARNLE